MCGYIKYAICIAVLFIVFMMTCFHAPSPYYLRPGHPEWPAGWISGVPLDSLEHQVSVFKAIGISCFGISIKEAPNREKHILEICERYHVKLFLQMDDLFSAQQQPISKNLLNSGLNSETKYNKHEVILNQISEALRPWMQIKNSGFPIDIIPAIQYGLGTCKLMNMDSVQCNQAFQNMQIAQQCADSLVPGLLVFRPMDVWSLQSQNRFHNHETDSYLKNISVLQPIVLYKDIDSNEREVRDQLAFAQKIAVRHNALFIPKIDFLDCSVISQKVYVLDSLISIPEIGNADAVLWNGITLSSSQAADKIGQLHEQMRMRLFRM